MHIWYRAISRNVTDYEIMAASFCVIMCNIFYV